MGDTPYQDPFGSQLIQRCVIVQRDERGYGLTVSGDNPVFIQSVKDNGAAYRAGVQQGDRIIKVNGTLVTQSNHVEVVKMIRSGPYVALTLLGRPPGSNGPPLKSPHTGSSPTNQTNTTTAMVGNRPTITNPQPADPEKGAEMRNERLNTYRNMLEQEKQLYEKTRTEYSVNPTEKLQKDLNGIATRIRVLEQQLQKAYSEGAYPKAVITTGNPLDNSELMGDEQNVDSSRRKIDSKIPSRRGVIHTRQRSTPETLGQMDDNYQTTAGLKRNNSDVQAKEAVRQKLRRGTDFRNTQKQRAPDIDSVGRVRHTSLFSKSLPGDGGDSDMGDVSPGSTPPSQRKSRIMKPPDGMEGFEDLMNPSNAVHIQKASVGTIEDNVAVNPPQIHILSMEDDEFPSDTENFDDHGPFNRFSELENKPAHMAVFLHYLISNSDPSSLFFYLVTDSYKSGSLREMKKWVYEIFSTFLAPSAPLRITVQDVVVKSIENTTNNQRDNEEAMRGVFHSARGTALDEIKELLADFRNKRALGLGSIFGDQQLQMDMDKSQELKIVEQTLIPHLERLTALEAEREAKNVAMAAALTTFLKNVGVRVAGNALERCPSFTARDKRSLLPTKKSTKKHVKGHLFQEAHFYNTAFCNHCDGLLWGIGNQGYQCNHCEFTIHKTGLCLDNLEEHCQGSNKKSKKMPFSKKVKRPDRTSSSAYPGSDVKSTGYKDEVLSPTSPAGPGQHIVGPSKSHENDDEINMLNNRGVVENMLKSWPDDGTGPSVFPHDSGISGTESIDSADVIEGAGESGKYSISKKKSLSRSESLKAKVKRKPSDRRSRSDVDMDQQNVQVALDASNASSSSSLSGRSQDSPSASVDSLASKTIEEYVLEDSDMEADADTPNWQDLVDKDMVKRLKPKEVKRQEIINELFYTEKSHVRTLKVLDRVFCQPMLRESIMPKEMIMAVFPNLSDLIECHMALNNVMKKERRTSHIIQDIGDMLLRRFDGEGGETMKRVCATFNQNQKAALEMLKSREKKDSRLEKFKSDAESNPLCQRLPFSALLSTGFQRLTKYPLLIENLLKYSSTKTEEFKKLEKVRDCCKDLLAHVNTGIKECENQQELLEISKKVDKGPLERSNNEIVKEFKSLDLTSRKLVHHSTLIWKLSKTKNIELHALLLEDILVLLQKQDDKYILKCHSTTVPTMKEDQKNTHSPIIKLNSVLCRPVATNKYAFFLVSTSPAGPQIYELVTKSKSDREVWMKRILAAQDIAKKRPSRRGAKVATVPTVTEEGEEDSLPGDELSREDNKTPTVTETNRHNSLVKTEANRKQKPEELEAALAESVRTCTNDDMSASYNTQKIPDDMDTEELLDFMVTMSCRITPLLRDVHEKRTCSKVEDNIMKALEIMEQRLSILQSGVLRNETERHDLKRRCGKLQGENDQLESEKERLQQELSASQHELHYLQESMQQYRGGDQNLTSADANSYESLPTTDIDRDEPTPNKTNNRLSYSGDSSSTTDSEDNPVGELEDTGYAGHGGSATVAAMGLVTERPKIEPVQVVSNVVTELQPAREHTAVELANDQLACLHAATAVSLDHKILQGRGAAARNVDDTAIKYAEEEDDDLAPLGAPPPIPVEEPAAEERVNGGRRTSSDIEYRDSDMDEALESTQEIVHQHSQQHTPITTVQASGGSHLRHSSPPETADVPLEDRGGNDAGRSGDNDDASALRTTTEMAATAGDCNDAACHIEVVGNSNERSNEVSQVVKTTIGGGETSLISNATDMQNQSELTSSDSTEDNQATQSDSSQPKPTISDPECTTTETNPNDLRPESDTIQPVDNLITFEEVPKCDVDVKSDNMDDGGSDLSTKDPVQMELHIQDGSNTQQQEVDLSEVKEVDLSEVKEVELSEVKEVDLSEVNLAHNDDHDGEVKTGQVSTEPQSVEIELPQQTVIENQDDPKGHDLQPQIDTIIPSGGESNGHDLQPSDDPIVSPGDPTDCDPQGENDLIGQGSDLPEPELV